MSDLLSSENLDFTRVIKNCRRTHFLDAAKETAATAVTALLPLIVGLGIASLLKTGSPIGVFKTFFESNSALFVAASLAGPLVYIIFKRYGKLPGTLTFKFPAGLFFLLFAVAVCLAAAVMFTLSVAFTGNGDGTAPAYADNVNIETVRWVSFAILILSFTVLFFVSGVRNMLDDSYAPADIMRQNTQSFQSAWKKRHE